MGRRKIVAPKKLWVVRDAEGQPMGTPMGTIFFSQDEAETAAKAVGRSRHMVQTYTRKDPKPRGRKTVDRVTALGRSQ